MSASGGIAADPSIQKSNIRKLLLGSLFVRLIACAAVLIIGNIIGELYFISDDINYEKMALDYLLIASSPIDAEAFVSVGASGYLQLFWPYVMCITAYIFKTIYTARFINVILSVIAVKYVYDLTYAVSENERTAMRAAKLYAFLPYPVISCCFPIKDIFLTVAVLSAFTLFVKFQKNQKVRLSGVIIFALLMIGAYFARGGVVEVLGLFFMIFVFKRFYDNKNTFALILSVLLAILALVFLGEYIIEAFAIKVEDYGEVANAGSLMQIGSIYEIYKLPVTYFVTSMMPVTFKVFGESDLSIWYQIMTHANLSLIPIAVGNFMYIFCKKKNFLFWISSLTMYCAVIILSSGVFRHYMFLFPIAIVNFSMYMEENTDTVRQNNCTIISFAIILAILVYSVI